MARLGTALTLLLAGCGTSHPVGGDAEVRTGDADTPSGTCPSGVGGPSGAALGASPSGEGPWDATISGVDETGVELGLSDGELIRFQWEGTSLDELSPGQAATLRREERWTVLEAGGVSLWALQAYGFVGGDLIGASLAVEGGPGSMFLTEDCTLRDGTGGGCGEPPRLAQIYALDVEGDRLRAGESRRADGYEVWFGGAAQYPGYGSDMCVVEAAFIASVALKVTGGAGRSCEDIEAEYDGLIGDHRGCDSAADCQTVFGHCGVGLGGCYYSMNADLSAAMGVLADEYAAAGCTRAVCDCPAPPETHFCNMGQCDFGP
ncbi:MAG: hypothetical protein VYE22_31240 [Myxococcota bacterium]|nr:hypothetical protein [Myxococcota bacterium]